MARFAWYWNRLRAMGPAEVGAHVAKKLRQFVDARRLPDWSALSLEPDGQRPFPVLPGAASAPDALREALRQDVADILGGRWRAFGHWELKVDVPPRWQKDYLVGVDLQSDESAFKLSARQQPGGADIKVIWDPSRWNQLVRLAQGAYVLNDRPAAETCVQWLEDWVKHNPAYCGLNWTSALETGLRLVQFTWIDALLTHSRAGVSPAQPGEAVPGGAGARRGDRSFDPNSRQGDAGPGWAHLRSEVLPAHVWFTWRYRSSGSSANNHLLGELAGLIVAIARWPQLAQLAVPLTELQEAWERAVLAQFAGDGGNREQALGYHLFSWEFCWQTQAALRVAGRRVSSGTAQRLLSAARFYAQLKADEWDYGDSDNAFVTPFFARETQATEEWRAWFLDSLQSPAIRYWWGDANLGLKTPGGKLAGHSSGYPSGLAGTPAKSWKLFRDSGYALQRSEDWQLRWDLSPLGFLATAAHGHLDALHVSIWHRGVAFVIDPGTGAYYADRALRDHLASWSAHNGPHPAGIEFPKRLGTFLWGTPHAVPVRMEEAADELTGALSLPAGQMSRTIRPVANDNGWQIEDAYQPASAAPAAEFSVRWQFAPGTSLARVGERAFRMDRAGVTLAVRLDEGWSSVVWFMPDERQQKATGTTLQGLGDVPLAAVCSPAFRRVAVGPYLLLTGKAQVAAATMFAAVER
jgi:hypothetical protein